MSDVFSKEKRSRIMSKVKGKNTSIELRVRKVLHKRGFRYRLNNRHLPGNPDITFRNAKIAVFVNGCFWHGHSCKRGARLPKTNSDYWKKKIEKNMARDQIAKEKLKEMGWRAFTIWECNIDAGIEDLTVLLRS